jgi:ribonuclease E
MSERSQPGSGALAPREEHGSGALAPREEHGSGALAPREEHALGAEQGSPGPSEAAPAAEDGAGQPERKKRRRGSRGGRNRSKGRAATSGSADAVTGTDDDADAGVEPELPERAIEGRVQSAAAADAALVRRPPPVGAPSKPKIGDTMPAPPRPPAGRAKPGDDDRPDGPKRRRRRGGRGRGAAGGGGGAGAGRSAPTPIEALMPTAPVDLDEDEWERRRGRERKGRPVGRYMMCVHVTEKATQMAVLEGRALIEHYVSRPSDDVSQIHGNIYLGRVQNVLPGMEAAFVDISTPKNAVLYRGDVHYDPEDIEEKGAPRIEQLLRPKQTIVCQVTKNPIGAKGARLTQEVSLPGRFVVLIPNSTTYGISKRLADDERKRLRQLLDRVKPKEHGIIVRTAAENVTTEEIENDVRRLVHQWEQIDALAKRSQAPALLYREPDMAVRVIREEFNADYRAVVIDDHALYEAVRDYVASISPALADRVEYYDPDEEQLPLFERFHVHEQLHKALDRKVWLPSGGSLIIEHTEALTVIDVNTGKNVGTSSLEETVFRNNLEAAVEVARQLRLRDIGGIIVVDFIDMEIEQNRREVTRVFRDALARDKTRTQVFEISDLGLCEMTRKRIGEGLLESFAGQCPQCEGRGVLVDPELLPES